MNPNSSSYLYQHVRLDTNEVFYIGIGTQDKFKRAYCTGKKRNNFWNNVANKTYYRIDILRKDIPLYLAKKFEVALIKFYGRKDIGLGNLCNLTNGGDGVVGHINSPDTKYKKSISKIGILNPMFGKQFSKDTRLKMSIARTGKTKEKMSDNSKLKVSLSRKGKCVGVGNQNSKTVLNIYSGIFFNSMSEACPINIKPRTFKAMLTGQNSNRTDFVLV